MKKGRKKPEIEKAIIELIALCKKFDFSIGSSGSDPIRLWFRQYQAPAIDVECVWSIYEGTDIGEFYTINKTQLVQPKTKKMERK